MHGRREVDDPLGTGIPIPMDDDLLDGQRATARARQEHFLPRVHGVIRHGIETDRRGGGIVPAGSGVGDKNN